MFNCATQKADRLGLPPISALISAGRDFDEAMAQGRVQVRFGLNPGRRAHLPSVHGWEQSCVQSCRLQAVSKHAVAAC